MTGQEVLILARGLFRAAIDSNETTEVHMAEELTGRDFYEKYLPEFRASPEGQELLREQPELRSDQVDFEKLRKLPENTLGYAYARHLDGNNITADFQAAPTTYIDDPEMSYVMRRYRQTHDVWHPLVGLGIRGHEEVIIHSFSLGQLMLPVSMLVVFFGTFKHIIGEFRWDALRHSLYDAYKSGRNAQPLLPVYWEKYWEDSLDSVRARFNIKPLNPLHL